MKTMNRFHTFFVILLALGSWIQPAEAQDASTWMPDANLRDAVREDLGLASDEVLTQAKMLDLTSLHAPQEQISNLTGLEHATNLTKLIAWQNQVSSLTPLENLTNLTEIRMGNNDISDVTPLDDLTSLTKLGLRHNSISNVTPLAGLVDLTWLRLAGNSITDFSPLVTLVNVTNSDVNLPDPDTTAPSVSITVPSSVQNGAFSVTITFSETVSGFVQSDVSLSGSAASITSWGANSDDTVYTATITPAASGTVTIGVAANVATDAANNQNTGTTSQTVTVDIDKPTVTIGVPSGVQNGAFDATITFTEAVSGFGQADLSLSGTANASITWWTTANDTIYTATITPANGGTVIINVPANVATDAAGNENSAAVAQTVSVQNKDTEAPTVSISVPAGVQNGPFGVSFVFSEAVSVFEDDEASLTGTASATITAWDTTDDITYTATITPTSSGEVIINVPAGIAADSSRNPNTVATPQTVSVDIDAPSVTISVPSDVQHGAFGVTITFTEAVSGFEQADLVLTNNTTNASITLWSTTDDITYNAEISPTTSGEVTLNIAAGVATDAEFADAEVHPVFSPPPPTDAGAGNPNTAATPQTVSVDMDAPSVTISVPSGVQNGAFDVTVTFTEGVSDFAQSDLSLADSIASASITSWRSNTDNTSFTAAITPTTSGEMKLSVAADVATDFANNPNTAATSQTVTIDVDRPTVTIGVPTGTQTGPFDASITFSETVSGFTQSDVSLTGSAASITAWSVKNDNTIYTTTIAPTASGTMTVAVAADVATDAAENSNTVATSKTVTISIPVLVSIPDAALATLVRTELGLTANAAITTADMTRLTSLGGGSARRLGISNLTGLEHATNLTSLTLPRNNISDLSPLENLTSLRSLSLSRNEVSNLTALQQLTELTSLGLKQNNIGDLSPLSGLMKLNTLVLKNNSFTDVSPLGDLVAEDGTTNLVTLLLEHNSIANTTANATALQALSDAGTNIDIAVPDVDVNAAPHAIGSIPDQTLLRPNYPNPFNPETWIPYHLANDTDVQISIYDISGGLVRQLDLGYQQAGYYTDRSRAAYWDGRNGSGEFAASGVYFYTLSAEAFRSTRKMLVGK